MNMQDLSGSNDLKALCLSHKVNKLYVFGSVANGNSTETSDIDLLVEINEADPIARGSLLISFWNQMEKHFKRKIDLLTPSSLKNPFLKLEIEKSKVAIFNA